MFPKKYVSGSEKRKRKKQQEDFISSQRERSFSKLKLLKSYLRTTMTQDRLNGLAILSIEKNMLKNIELQHIIDDFASKSVRRNHFR
ncbi:putative HAT dimerization domain-containing protein [Rosa chinensis]|uniref:Putative HAT dimerization domain-containing protein n=1 Tax=Rosa chinensis TaxID=74649 RepID=A0A2P6RWK9_ROSCH|nr:putative HAT dimerization domain-containing protein [Rosa chinensis]